MFVIFLGLDEEDSLRTFGDYNIHGEILEQVGMEGGDNLEDLANQQVTYTDLQRMLMN